MVLCVVFVLFIYLHLVILMLCVLVNIITKCNEVSVLKVMLCWFEALHLVIWEAVTNFLVAHTASVFTFQVILAVMIKATYVLVKYWHPHAMTHKVVVWSILSFYPFLCLPWDTFHNICKLRDFLVSQVIPICDTYYSLLILRGLQTAKVLMLCMSLLLVEMLLFS